MHGCSTHNKAYGLVDQCILGDKGDTSSDETGKSFFLGSLSGTCNLRSHVKIFRHIDIDRLPPSIGKQATIIHAMFSFTLNGATRGSFVDLVLQSRQTSQLSTPQNHVTDWISRADGWFANLHGNCQNCNIVVAAYLFLRGRR